MTPDGAGVATGHSGTPAVVGDGAGVTTGHSGTPAAIGEGAGVSTGDSGAPAIEMYLGGLDLDLDNEHGAAACGSAPTDAWPFTSPSTMWNMLSNNLPNIPEINTSALPSFGDTVAALTSMSGIMPTITPEGMPTPDVMPAATAVPPPMNIVPTGTSTTGKQDMLAQILQQLRDLVESKEQARNAMEQLLHDSQALLQNSMGTVLEENRPDKGRAKHGGQIAATGRSVGSDGSRQIAETRRSRSRATRFGRRQTNASRVPKLAQPRKTWDPGGSDSDCSGRESGAAHRAEWCGGSSPEEEVSSDSEGTSSVSAEAGSSSDEGPSSDEEELPRGEGSSPEEGESSDRDGISSGSAEGESSGGEGSRSGGDFSRGEISSSEEGESSSSSIEGDSSGGESAENSQQEEEGDGCQFADSHPDT